MEGGYKNVFPKKENLSFKKKKKKQMTSKNIEKTNSNNIKSPATNLDPHSYSKIFFFSFVRLKVIKIIYTCE